MKFPIVAPPAGGAPVLPSPGQPGPLRPDEFQPGSVANVTQFNFTGVDPPSPLYVQRDDQVLVTVASVNPAETVTFRLRFLRVPEPQGGQPDLGGVGKSPGHIITRGIVETVEVNVAVLGARANAQKFIALAEGYILSITALSTTQSLRGETMVRAQLIRGGIGFNFAALVLFSDYTTLQGPVSWPPGRQQNPIEGPGWKHSLQQANPAAGADWTLTVVGGQRLRIESLNAVFTAAVAVANRQVQLVVDDGANVMGVFAAQANIVATNVANVTATTGNINTPIVATDILIPLPSPLILMAGWRLRANTVGIQAADQWSAIWFNVEEWIEGI